MTLYQFNTLGTFEKATILWDDGVFLMYRIDGCERIALYQIFTFYVEVFYDDNSQEIRTMRSFSATDELAEYLSQIDIPLA